MFDNAIDMSQFIIITSNSSPLLLDGFDFPRSSIVGPTFHDVPVKHIQPLDELYILIRQLLQCDVSEKKKRRVLQTAISTQLGLLLTYLAQLNCETRVSDLNVKETIERTTSMEENDVPYSQQRHCVATIGTQTSRRGQSQSEEKSPCRLPIHDEKFQFLTESASDIIDSCMNGTDSSRASSSSSSFEITQDNIKTDQLSSAPKTSGRIELPSHSGESIPQRIKHPEPALPLFSDSSAARSASRSHSLRHIHSPSSVRRRMLYFATSTGFGV